MLLRVIAASAGSEQRGERSGEVTNRHSLGLDPSEQKRIRIRENTRVGRSEPVVVTSGSCCFGYPLIRFPVRVGEHPQTLSRRRVDLLSSFRQGGAEDRIIERREEVVASCMETDLESCTRKRGDVRHRQGARPRPDTRTKLGRDGVAPFWREALDHSRCLVNRVWSAASRRCEIEFRQRFKLQRLSIWMIDEFL